MLPHRPAASDLHALSQTARYIGTSQSVPSRDRADGGQISSYERRGWSDLSQIKTVPTRSTKSCAKWHGGLLQTIRRVEVPKTGPAMGADGPLVRL